MSNSELFSAATHSMRCMVYLNLNDVTYQFNRIKASNLLLFGIIVIAGTLIDLLGYDSCLSKQLHDRKTINQ